MGEAAGYPEALTKEKHFRYYGDIYMNIASDSTFNTQYPNAYFDALDNYSKALALSKEYEQEIFSMLNRLRIDESQVAYKAYENNNACLAAEHYNNIVLCGNLLGIIDSMVIFNSGICFQECGNLDKAIANFSRCAEINYSSEESYLNLFKVLVVSGKRDEALIKLTEGRNKHPNGSKLLLAEVDLYIEEENYEKAIEILTKVIETDSENSDFWVYLGVIYEKSKKNLDAENAYLKALELKQDNFIALYNIALLFYYKGEAKHNECDGIRGEAYQPCLVEKRAIFAKAAEYLEAVRAIDSSDPKLKELLVRSYRKSNQTEKADSVK